MYQDFSLHEGAVLDSGKFRYTIVKVLGSGTFGITYLATIPVRGSIGSLEMKVAVKEFFMKDVCSRQSDGSLQEMSQGGLVYNYAMKFRKEAENLSRLDHPQIVRVLDVFDANNTVYYAMEFVEGDNLNEYLKGRGRMSEDEALSFIRSIASPLAYMHEHKMLHLDLKPDNVMRRSSDGKCVLIDFGLSKYYADNGEPESSTNIGMGTPGYAPIEQAQAGRNGQVYPTLDIYALGGTFYKLLTGETPPEASELLDGFPREKFLYPGSGISVSVVDAIEKTMSPRRLDRPQSVHDFLKLLDSLQSDTSSPADDFTVLDENKKHSAASGPSSASGASGPSEPSGSSNSQGVSGNFRENDDKVAKGGASDKPSSSPNRAKRWIIVACVIVGLIAGFFLLKSLMSGGGADDGQVAALQREQYVKDSLEDVQRSQHIKDSIAAAERAEQEAAAREEAARQEAARIEAALQEAARQEAARIEAALQEAARQEVARQETALQEAERQEAARQEAERQEEALPYKYVEVEPSFQGGTANDFSKWVQQRLVYPEIALEKGISGTVILYFEIDEDGNLINVKVLKGVDKSLDDEAVRVVKSSPKWTPGRQYHIPVKCQYQFPVTFQLR